MRAIKTVAARLGNTPAVCRKCYVHPALVEWYLSGDMNKSRILNKQKRDQLNCELQRDEAALMRLLRRERKAD